MDGILSKPNNWNQALELMRERGRAHEDSFIEHLVSNGSKIVRIDGTDVDYDAVAQTSLAMRAGTVIIVQGALSHNGWSGRPDVLRRVEQTSSLGAWSYEVIDTKLARETKAGTILQLCLYSQLLGEMQGILPDYMYVVVPWTEYEPEAFRFVDFAAYFRRVKQSFEQALSKDRLGETYPDPRDHCEVCS